MPDTYLVVQPEQIIAQDLAHAIRAFDPGAEVHVVGELGDALALLEQVRAVFLHDEPARLWSVEAGQRVAEAGVPVIFLGTMAEARPEGAVVLASPFSEVTVAAALRRVLGEAADL